MTEGNSLINFGDVSKPATVLIEKISNAIGVLYEPTRTKRMAKADVIAAKIRAEGDIEITDIQQRAIQRLIESEGKRQENIERITEQAAIQLNESASPQDIEDDWISNFFEKCKNISNVDMQNLWAGLLAGEANKPGSYSKRTIELISTLDRSEADLFTTICGLSLTTEPGKGQHLPIFLNESSPLYKDLGLTFTALSNLDSIGLIKFNNTGGVRLPGVPKRLSLFYFDTVVLFSFPNENNNNMNLGNVMLTQVGMQLAPICGAHAIPGFLEHITSEYAKNKIIVNPIALEM